MIMIFWSSQIDKGTVETVFLEAKQAKLEAKKAKFSSRGSAPHPAGAPAPDPMKKIKNTEST